MTLYSHAKGLARKKPASSVRWLKCRWLILPSLSKDSGRVHVADRGQGLKLKSFEVSTW